MAARVGPVLMLADFRQIMANRAFGKLVPAAQANS